MYGYYYFINKKPAEKFKKNGENSINDIGTGWIECDLSKFIKPELTLVNGKWRVIETATPDEILEVKKQKQLEQITALNEKWKQDGQTYYNEVKNQITFSLIGKPNAMVIMSEINKTVYPLLNKIKEGDWPLAVIDYTDGKNNPTIQEVIDLFNEVGQKAISYYQTEYPH